MFGWMLFLHFAGLFVWLGALLAQLVVLVIMRKQPASAENRAITGRVISAFGLLSHPGAIVVLISGVYMIVSVDWGSDKPLWLEIMEKGGGTIIVLTVVLTGLLGSKARKRLANAASGQHATLSGYRNAISIFIVLIVSVLLAVSLKV